MKLDYSYNDLSLRLSQQTSSDASLITTVVYDSRRITNAKGALFFALKGVFRDGHDFVADAYTKGVRHFVISDPSAIENCPDAKAIVVNDTLLALQELAAYHRSRFDCPVVAITGSNGKTTVKEWLSYLLSKQFNVARSPKSYNSQLGVPLSLLELNPSTEVAVIEVGVSEPGGMKKLEEIVQPTLGIFTSFGSAHRSFFASEEEHLNEKLKLFDRTSLCLYPAGMDLTITNGKVIHSDDYSGILESFPIRNKVNLQNAALAVAAAQELGMDNDRISAHVAELHPLALRLETFEGVDNSTIINDTYSMDVDSLRLSLEYQLSHSNGKRRVVIIGLESPDENRERELSSIVEEFSPDELIFHHSNKEANYSVSNAIVLLKGHRSAQMERIANRFRLQHHQTYLEIDLTAIRHNINYHKSQLKPETKLLCMVKASSYGSDAKTMGKFLESVGVDYLGVAYPDEGIQLREVGISLPILVMNCEERSFAQCIEHSLEPAIFSSNQLTGFIKELINHGKSNYPVHIKLETGMNRLGFTRDELPTLIEVLKGQPEVVVKSVYSHLAESDIPESAFTQHQIDTFGLLADQLDNEFAYPIMRHILNSSGIVNYPDAQMNMVRLGIGMYGATKNSRLKPGIAWYSSVSQVKRIDTGETVGYGRTFVADKPTTIAVIPVGYADGFRRSLSQGKGGVFIGGHYCPTIGNVCMDMIMVDVSDTDIQPGDRVEIIGEHQPIEDFAKRMDTIAYEVMTSLSMRMHRLFVDQ